MTPTRMPIVDVKRDLSSLVRDLSAPITITVSGRDAATLAPLDFKAAATPSATPSGWTLVDTAVETLRFPWTEKGTEWIAERRGKDDAGYPRANAIVWTHLTSATPLFVVAFPTAHWDKAGQFAFVHLSESHFTPLAAWTNHQPFWNNDAQQHHECHTAAVAYGNAALAASH